MRTFDDILGKEDKTFAEILLIQAIATLSTQPAFASMTPDDVFNTIVVHAFPVPEVLFFFDNGSTLAGDVAGRQMPRYQGPHREALARLEEDGIDLTRVKNIYGSPTNPVKWVRPTPELLAREVPGEALAAGEAHAATEFEVTRARLAGVCRVCGDPIPPAAGQPLGWEREFGERTFPPPALTLNFGAEFAHTACLPPDPDRVITPQGDD